MTESDDPVITPAVANLLVPAIIGAGAGFGASKAFGGRPESAVRDIPSRPAEAENVKKTAALVERLSEVGALSRKRAAAFRPRGFAPPKLGKSGLLGVSLN